MKSILSAVMVGLFMFIAPKISAAADFYQWVSDTGTLESTDDIKNVPEKYRSQVKERTWIELTEKTDGKFTPVVVPAGKPEVQPEIEPDISDYVLEANAEDCEQPVRSLPPVYRQVGDYTRLVYRYTDSCGNVVSELDGAVPRVIVNR